MEALVRPVIEAAGLELWEVTYRKEGGRMVLRIAVDREGGVDVDTLSETSDRVSRRLDLESFSPRVPYALEVTSPGLERVLREPRHFARSVGRTARITTREPVDGQTFHEGPILRADDDAVTIAVAAGERRIAFADVASARTTFTWGGGR
ncbi:MAG: ribosome maturation factor RimP [Actinomycetota bacterium]